MSDDPFRLDGELALVTGARRGIGRAMATALARAGADIVATSATLETDAEVGREVRAAGVRYEGLACDLRDRSAVVELADHLVGSGRPPTIVVNNAGTIRRAPAAEHSLEMWDEVVEVNLSAQFVLSQALARPMISAGRGKIIFTASLLSFQGGINVPGYAASKSGVAGLTHALANEWAAHGVNVNAIAPGYIATDNTQALREDQDRSRSILERIPAGRWGSGEDIAGATVFLASRASDYVNGIVMPVDGGWLGR